MLQAVNFDDGIKMKVLPKLAFASCHIISIRIPGSVKIIETECFECCKNLREATLEIESELKKIAKSAFYGTSIKSIKVPDGFGGFEDVQFNDEESRKYFLMIKH
jgi:hypothetical protein